MEPTRLLWLPVLTAALLVAAGCERTQTVSYQQDVVPILDKYCKQCHEPGQAGYVVSGFELGSMVIICKFVFLSREEPAVWGVKNGLIDLASGIKD